VLNIFGKVGIEIVDGRFDDEKVLEISDGYVLTLRQDLDGDSLVMHSSRPDDVFELGTKFHACYLDGKGGFAIIIGKGPYRVYYKSEYGEHGIDLEKPTFVIKNVGAEPTALHHFYIEGKAGFAIGFSDGTVRFHTQEGKFVRTMKVKHQRKPAVTAILSVPGSAISKDAKYPDEYLHVQTDIGTSIRVYDPNSTIRKSPNREPLPAVIRD
jgi:hypothetical protein